MTSIEVALATIELARQTARMEALMDAEKVVRDRADRMKSFQLSETKALINAANAIAALQVIPEGDR